MKKTNPLKIIISLIAFTIFVLVLNGCKKADFKNNTRIGEKSLDMIRANVAKQMEHEGGIPQIFVRNQKVTTQWVDRFHNPVTNEQLQKNSFASQCNYDIPAYCNLVQYARVYRCGSNSGSTGYFLQFEYEISWNNNIIKDDGNSNLTSGYIKIVDGSSNIVQSLTLDYTNSDVQIVEIGQDPNPYFPNNYIFRVKFVTTDFNTHLVSDTYINSGSYDVKISAMFVSDCHSGGDPYSLWLAPVTAYGFTGASGDDPCDRHDKTWVAPPYSGSNVLYASGYNSGINSSCGFGGSFIATDLQEIQYNVDGGTWTNMDNYSATSLPIYGSPFVRAADASYATIASGNHLVGVRVRNWKYVLTNPSGWPIPDFNDDCFSPGDNPSSNTSSSPYSTYAYSYWYCINIP